jgi:hypothetical protein
LGITRLYHYLIIHQLGYSATKLLILSFLTLKQLPTRCLVMLLPNSGGNKKTTIGNTDDCQLMTFGQQHLNGATNWSAAEGGQVLPHFEHIVSGALTPPCPMAAVF